MLPIDHHIPPPTRHHTVDDFRRLQPGDSILITFSLYPSLWKEAKNLGWRITTKIEGEGFRRIWRLSDTPPSRSETDRNAETKTKTK